MTITETPPNGLRLDITIIQDTMAQHGYRPERINDILNRLWLNGYQAGVQAAQEGRAQEETNSEN